MQVTHKFQGLILVQSKTKGCDPAVSALKRRPLRLKVYTLKEGQGICIHTYLYLGSS